MSTFNTKIIDNIICSQVSGELDAALSNLWIEKLEEQESQSGLVTKRFHDVRGIDAVRLSFDDLWGIAQRRLSSYQNLNETRTVFWVSTPLNYGVSRMYQALTDGTPFKIEVLYKLDEIADFLDVDINLLENISY